MCVCMCAFFRSLSLYLPLCKADVDILFYFVARKRVSGLPAFLRKHHPLAFLFLARVRCLLNSHMRLVLCVYVESR